MRALYEIPAARGFERALERASAEARKRAERVSRDTAINVTRRARALAPRDRGDLINAISFDGKGLNWRVGLVDTRIPSRGGDNSAHLNPSVYGVWYEFGFVSRQIQRREYMGPSSRAEQPRHAEALAQALEDTFSKVDA